MPETPPDEEHVVGNIGPVMREWLETWRPGDLVIQIPERGAFDSVPLAEPPKERPVWGIPIHLDPTVPEGHFRIGIPDEKREGALQFQRWIGRET